METVPIELERINEEVQDAINDYDLIEEFYYPLSQVIIKLETKIEKKTRFTISDVGRF